GLIIRLRLPKAAPPCKMSSSVAKTSSLAVKKIIIRRIFAVKILYIYRKFNAEQWPNTSMNIKTGQIFRGSLKP
ncbi:MAG TPA: hypothetical protein PKE06_12185, partial [Flavilitoribacter sp.]|nr:hypothetical protein [Flavilitoribacter sp.]HMQ90519.1 hypothetical protein [Flavilitoribacter sp.]